MVYLICYGIGYVLAFALFQVLSSRTRDKSDRLSVEIAANLTLALFWPVAFAALIMAWAYGYVSAAVNYRRIRNGRR